MKDRKPLVFISYSHRDRNLCSRIASMLEDITSAEVWYDKGLIPGEVYRKKIADKISQADYFLVLLSEDSIRSEWVLDEVEYARKLHKRILPIYADDLKLPDEIDMILHRYHSLFWSLRSSDTQFEDSLRLIFQENEPVKEKTAKENSVIRNEFSAAINQEMMKLLELEKQKRFSQCYTAENACLLGKAYLFGGPCAIDRKTARFYFRIAQYMGNPDGSFYLLQMKLEDRETATWDEPDREFCAPILEEIRSLAGQGCEPAILYLANLLWHGKYGCEKDIVESARLYEICALKGNARAQYIMAANYYYGDGVQQDYDLAVMYANLAVEQSYLKSWRRWGKFYRDGLAVPQDHQKARNWYEKGARMGDFNCFNKVGDMLYYGWGFPADHSEAFQYYLQGEKAPEIGQKYALWKAKLALGRCYELGHGVKADLETAAEKYLEGYRFGSEECLEAYLRCSNLLRSGRKTDNELL